MTGVNWKEISEVELMGLSNGLGLEPTGEIKDFYSGTRVTSKQDLEWGKKGKRKYKFGGK